MCHKSTEHFRATMREKPQSSCPVHQALPPTPPTRAGTVKSANLRTGNAAGAAAGLESNCAAGERDGSAAGARTSDLKRLLSAECCLLHSFILALCNVEIDTFLRYNMQACDPNMEHGDGASPGYRSGRSLII